MLLMPPHCQAGTTTIIVFPAIKLRVLFSPLVMWAVNDLKIAYRFHFFFTLRYQDAVSEKTTFLALCLGWLGGRIWILSGEDENEGSVKCSWHFVQGKGKTQYANVSVCASRESAPTSFEHWTWPTTHSFLRWFIMNKHILKAVQRRKKKYQIDNQ